MVLSRKVLLGSVAVVLVAVAARRSLQASPVAWHQGADWEEYLKLYDEKARLGFSGCSAARVQTDFGPTQVYACGNPADPAVLLQGGASSSCLIYTQWILPRLVEQRRFALAVDYVCDLGRSSPRDGDKANCPRSQQDLVTWIGNITSAYKIDGPVSMVGYSYGAFISASVAVKAPQAVDRLVLLAPAGIFAPVTTEFALRAVFHFNLYSGATGFAFENWMSAVPGFEFSRDMEADVVAFSRATKRVSPHATHLLVHPYHFPSHELQALAAHPTLLILGENETVINAETAAATARGVPGIDTHVYPNTGHLLLIEHLRLQAEKDVVDFLF